MQQTCTSSTNKQNLVFYSQATDVANGGIVKNLNVACEEKIIFFKKSVTQIGHVISRADIEIVIV